MYFFNFCVGQSEIMDGHGLMWNKESYKHGKTSHNDIAFYPEPPITPSNTRTQMTSTSQVFMTLLPLLPKFHLPIYPLIHALFNKSCWMFQSEFGENSSLDQSCLWYRRKIEIILCYVCKLIASTNYTSLASCLFTHSQG